MRLNSRSILAPAVLVLSFLASSLPNALPAAAEPHAAASEELEGLRTETAKFFRNPDGTFRAKIYPAPIHYRGETGAWLDIEPTLVPSDRSGYAWTNAAGPVRFDFASSARAGDTVLVTIGSESFRFGPAGSLGLGTPVVTGSQITYPNVLAGIDLRYTVTLRGLKEELVLNQIPAVNMLTFTSSGSMSLREADVGLEVAAANGDTALVVPPAFMHDSEAPGRHEVSYSGDVTVGLASAANQQTLTVSFDRAWLLDSARHWPVVVDPTTVLNPVNDTFVHQCYQGVNFDTDEDLRSGSYGPCEGGGGTSLARTYMKFSHSGFGNTSIQSATLKLYEWWSSSCTDKRMDVRRVTQNWTSSTLDWSPQPSIASTASAFVVTANGWSSACPAAWVNLDVTSLFQDWVDGTYPNYGLALLAANESDGNSWKRFRSMDYTTSSQRPYLDVTYNGAPSVPTSLVPTSGSLLTDSTPELSGIYNDPDAGDTGYLWFEVYRDDDTKVYPGSGQTAYGNLVTPNQRSYWTVPSGVLADNTRYYWKAKGWDGVSASAWTPATYFTLDNSPPSAPSVSSPTHRSPPPDKWYPNNDPQLQWLASDASTINGYSYQFDQVEQNDAGQTSRGTATSATFTDKSDGDWFFHIRARNGQNMWGDQTDFKVRIDTAAPSKPEAVSTTHATSVPSSRRNVDVTWTASADATSGITGYSWEFNEAENDATDATAENAEGDTDATSASLEDGQNWWFHVRAIDKAGNASADESVGPFIIDGTGPGSVTVFSTTHDERKWEPLRVANFGWLPPADSSPIAGYSVSFSRDVNDDPDEVVDTAAPTWTQSGIDDGVWFLRVRAQDEAGTWGPSSDPYEVWVDATEPQAPSITSSTHERATWVSNHSPAFEVISTPVSGVRDYEYAFDHSASPPITLPASNSEDGTPSFANEDDGVWYLHARVRSNSGLWSPFSSYEVRIDVTAPGAPGSVTSPDHNTTDPTNQRAVTVDWGSQPGTDATSGVAGYATIFNHSDSAAPTGPVNSVGTKLTSDPLDYGVWYFHVVTVDRAGNRSPDKVFGPITISEDAPPIVESQVREFITLWIPRVQDPEFGAEYVNTNYPNGYPNEILAEGFHSKNGTQKNYLIDRLNAAVYDPPVGHSAEENTAFRDTLYAFVFDKDTLRDIPNLSSLIADTIPVLPQRPDQTPQIVRDLSRTPQAPTLPSPSPAPTMPDSTLAPLTSGLSDLPSLTTTVAGRGLSAETLAISDNLVSPNSDPVAPVHAEIVSVAGETGLDPAPAPLFPQLEDISLDTATYAICWHSSSQSARCASLPTGTPIPFLVNTTNSVDVTGDGTSDVAVTFGRPLSVDPTYPTGLSAELTIERLSSSEFAGSKLNAHVWVVYDMVAADKRLILGFDGYDRGDGLANRTTAGFVLKSALGARVGDVSSRYTLNHQGPPAKWALTIGTRHRVNGNNSDPTDISLQFNALPAQLNGDIDFVDLTETAVTTRSVRVINRITAPPPGPPGTRTDLDGILNMTREQGTVIANMRVFAAGLPATTNVLVSEQTGGSEGNLHKVEVVNDGPAARVSVAKNSIDNTTSSQLRGDLRGLPEEASLTLIEKGSSSKAEYSASGSVTQVAGSWRRDDEAGLASAVTVRAADLPETFTVNYGAPDDHAFFADYDASAELAALVVGLRLRDQDLAVIASATDVPSQIDAAVNFADKIIDVSSNAPIGQLTAHGSRGGQKLYAPGRQHATVIFDSKEKVSASLRIDGLRAVKVTFGKDIHLESRVNPGGQPFLTAMRFGADQVSADIGQLPPTVDSFDLRRSNTTLDYTASARIDTLSVFARNPEEGPMLESRLVGLPSSLRLGASLNATKTEVTYAANGRLDGVEFLYNSSPDTSDASGVRAYGSVTDLPTSVRLVSDIANKKLLVTTDETGAVGRVIGRLTVAGGQVNVPSGEHATLVTDGNASGASVDVSGISRVEADYDKIDQGREVFEGWVNASPGGQPFKVVASLNNDLESQNDDTTVHATFDHLPATVHIKTDSGTKYSLYEGAPSAHRIVAYRSRRGAGTIQLDVSDVPTKVEVTGEINTNTGGTITLDASGSVGAVSAVYSPDVLLQEPLSGSGRYLGVAAHDLPAKATAVVGLSTHPTEKKITWTADSPITDLTIRANNYPINGQAGYLAATSVPAKLSAKYGENEEGDRLASFKGITGPVGSLAAALSNSGQPRLPTGNVVRVHTSESAQTFNVGVRLKNLTDAEYLEDGEGWSLAGTVNLSGEPLGVDVDARFPADEDGTGDEFAIKARGAISSFPDSFSISSDNEQIRYESTTNIDLSLEASVGWIAALNKLSAPGWYHGLSIRDAECSAEESCRPFSQKLCDSYPPPYNNLSACYALTTRAQLWGLANEVVVNLNEDPNPASPTITRVKLTNFSPPNAENTLQLYIDLKNLANMHEMFIEQQEIPSPVDLKFGPFATDGGRKANRPLRVRAETHHSRAMGHLVVRVFGLDDSTPDQSVRIDNARAELRASRIPATVVLDARFGDDSSLAVGTSSPMEEVRALVVGDFTHTPGSGSPETTLAASGEVWFQNIPASLGTNDEPLVELLISHPLTAEKPTSQAGDPLLTRCDGATDGRTESPTGAASGRGADSLPRVEFKAPSSGVTVGALIAAPWARFAGNAVDLTLSDTAFGFEELSKHVIVEPTQFASGIKVISDPWDDPAGVTRKIWFQTAFELDLPCMELAPKTLAAGQLVVAGKIDETRVKIGRLDISLSDVAHAELTAGSAYLAYGVTGRYGSFDFRARDVTATTHSELSLTVNKGFSLGVLPSWFTIKLHLDSPDEAGNPDDFEDGWHTLHAHELADSVELSKLSLCPQVGRLQIPCGFGLATRPGLIGMRANGAHFEGNPEDYINDTKHLFTFIDPGTNGVLSSVLDPVTAVALTPPGFDRSVCINFNGLNTPCWNG